jgi:hypothetical protein
MPKSELAFEPQFVILILRPLIQHTVRKLLPEALNFRILETQTFGKGRERLCALGRSRRVKSCLIGRIV